MLVLKDEKSIQSPSLTTKKIYRQVDKRNFKVNTMIFFYLFVLPYAAFSKKAITLWLWV
jgi:hypothetical protein